MPISVYQLIKGFVRCPPLAVLITKRRAYSRSSSGKLAYQSNAHSWA